MATFPTTACRACCRCLRYLRCLRCLRCRCLRRFVHRCRTVRRSRAPSQPLGPRRRRGGPKPHRPWHCGASKGCWGPRHLLASTPARFAVPFSGRWRPQPKPTSCARGWPATAAADLVAGCRRETFWPPACEVKRSLEPPLFFARVHLLWGIRVVSGFCCFAQVCGDDLEEFLIWAKSDAKSGPHIRCCTYCVCRRCAQLPHSERRPRKRARHIPEEQQ